MLLEGRILLGVLCASIGAYCATLVAIRVAVRLEFYDRPIGYKGHAAPTPYLGGAAVMVGFLLALAALADDAERSLPLAAGVALLWVVGTIDDRRHVAPLARVAVEVVVASGLWALGLGWDLGIGGGVDMILTCLWILAVVNAFNLFDNMDGAASTMALVVAGAVAVLGAIRGDAWLAATGAALAGSCLGFLPHNLTSPARIFLGDGGSMPLGFAVAAIVMMGAADAVAEWQALVVALLLVGIPALDTALVLVSRRRKGVSVLTGGRDHLTHRTRRRLRDARGVALVLGSVQALVAALALFAVQGGSPAIVAAVLLYLVIAGAAITLLEAEEDRLTTAVALGGAAAAPSSPEAPERRSLAGYAALVVLSLSAGLSPFWFGYYDPGTWLPLGIAVVILLATGTVARPPRLSVAGGVTLAALAGLAAWTLLSAWWAESVDQAVIEGNRMLVLVAVLALAMLLVRDDSRKAWMVGLLGAGVLAVGLWTLVEMIGPDGQSLFLTGRLHEPLGYINAEATVFIMGFWMSLALAERRQWFLAGPGLGLATLMASLVLLSQSRGAALALAGSTLVVLALVPGRRRRIFGLLLVGAAVAAVSGSLLDVYESSAAGLTPAVTRAAAQAAIVAAAASGAVWALVTFAGARALAASPAAVRRGATVALAAVAVVALLAAGSFAGRVADGAGRQYNAFVHLADPTGSVIPDSGAGSRLVSGAGNRFDYWHVAWDAWRRRPLLGIGAGNYDAPYFRQRSTSEDVRQPHSLELQTLSETGVIGALALLIAFVAVVAGAVKASAAARRSSLTHAVVVAGVGGATAWMVHTSVDWMHLLPGVTAIALCLIAVLLRQTGEPRQVARQAPGHLRPASVAVAIAIAALLVVAGASLTRQALADHFRQKALDALADDPADALVQANRSLRLNGDAVRTYYVKAAAQARFNRAADAGRTLTAAASKEPSDFVTWTLLGDLALRGGDARLAQQYYERAHRLNPRDPGLAALAENPASDLP